MELKNAFTSIVLGTVIEKNILNYLLESSMKGL